MAGMKFNADIDLKNIVKLRQEIDKLKKSLIEIASVPNSDAAIKQLESEIDRATKKLSEYKDSYAKLQKIKYDIDSSNSTVKRVKEETSALQSTNKWIIANTESVKEADRQIKQLKKDFSALSDEEKVGDTGTAKIRQIQQLAAQRLVEEEAVRKTIKAQKDQIIQSNAEEGSITALRKQLILLIKDYDDLGRVRRGGDAGKALLTQISNVQKELNAAEQASGRFQRNVGNYASAWNGLGNSVQQVARELPSLAVSAKTFFLAISNNLPILVDEIAKARKEYANFKAELKAGNKDVKAVAPVWQQLTRSILSWQTALVVGLTLLSVYGKDVIKWIGSLGKAEEAIKNLYTAQRDLYNVTSTGIEQSSKEITKLNSLYKIATDVTRTTKERNDAVKELKRSFPSHLKNLSDESIKNGEVAKSIKEQTRQIIANAKASVAADQIAKNWYKSFQAGVAKNIALLQKQRLEQNLLIAEQRKEEYSTINNPGAYDWASKQVDLIKESIEETDKEIKKQEALQDSYQKSSQSLEKLVTVAGLGGKYEDPDKNYNSILDQQKKIADLLDKQALERKRREEDLENQAFQARINTMEEGEAKIRAQRALDNKKEIQDLKRQREDYIRTEIEYQKKVFDEQEELKAKKIKGYKKKTFDSTSVSVDTSVLDSINQDILKGQANDVAKYYKEVLAKYQDYTAQRIAIEKQFLNDEKKLRDGLAKAKSDSEKKQYEDALKELDKQRKKTIDSISKSEIEDSGIWKMLMGDVDALPTDTLEKLLSDAEQLVKSTNLSATDMKAMMDTINSARQNLVARNPFKTLKEEYEKYQKAIKKGDKQGAFTSWSNVEQASESIKSNISTLGASLSSLGTTFSDELGEGIQKAVDIINDGITAFEVFGKTGEKSAGDTVKGISGIVGIITTLVGTVMNAFDSTKAEQERNIEYQRRQEGYWDSINYQVERYLELLKEAAGNDYFATATQSLTTLEKAREKAYKDIVKSMPVGDVDYTTFGLAQLFNYGKFSHAMTEYAFGGPQAKEIFDFIQANGGYDLENKLISEEAIWAMKSNADIWSKLPEWLQQAIDKFVEFNDQTKELEETLNEDLFQTTSQGLEEAILEGLKGGKRGIADFGEDFEEIMRNALLQSFVIDQLRGKAQEFYKKYTLLADSDENGKLDLTAEEISDLRKDWNDIIRAATEEAKNIDAIVGGSSSSSQEASKKVSASVTQDSIDEVSGRFTALQIAGEEIKNQNQLQTMSILELRADMLPIIANTTGIKDIASETRDLLRLSYEAIVDIRDNTNVIVKPIQQMALDIAEVKRNTSKL
ncbi:hypothetical protein F3B77_11970 [Bacteroides ovatus]|jgi:hypothetical protein|uniref:Phage tail tape measure protein n=1 Tax=Bacteroides ovatus TaxID=28116 RepID=A0A5M5M7P5_BACOV|nr:hypothetical protein [Bacteroides ovatus]KAA4070662.1 hypothetical protein F3D37_09315 [Bacteroides ovatus]KAA4078700.1 hypothetical protein F3D38_10350 [Bacteroides ovatus]KAA4097577.1 hypothetical protein F3D40_12295 [Bacteroides ovatus]KAA4112566.1 hypothetical protein F3D35_13230 [Bacteroides ovatus]KAA4114094.1 hypothetical protein F3D39_10550 [Bacteroides ovatus]